MTFKNICRQRLLFLCLISTCFTSECLSATKSTISGSYAEIEVAAEKMLVELVDDPEPAVQRDRAGGKVGVLGITVTIGRSTSADSRPRQVTVAFEDTKRTWQIGGADKAKSVRGSEAEAAALRAMERFVASGDPPFLMRRVEVATPPTVRIDFDISPQAPEVIQSLISTIEAVRGRPFLAPPQLATGSNEAFQDVFSRLHANLDGVRDQWLIDIGAVYDHRSHVIYVKASHPRIPLYAGLIAALAECLEHQYLLAEQRRAERWGGASHVGIHEIATATAGAIVLSSVFQIIQFEETSLQPSELIIADSTTWNAEHLSRLHEPALRGLVFCKGERIWDPSQLDAFYFGKPGTHSSFASSRPTAESLIESTQQFKEANALQLSEYADSVPGTSGGNSFFGLSTEVKQSDYANALRNYTERITNEFVTARGRVFVATSGYRDDSSAHKEGAIDFRSRDTTSSDRHTEAAALSQVLGEQFTVIVEEGYSPTEFVAELGLVTFAPMRVLTPYSNGVRGSVKLGPHAVTHTHVQRRIGEDIVALCDSLGLKPTSTVGSMFKGMRLWEPIDIDIDVGDALLRTVLRARAQGAATKMPDNINAGGSGGNRIAPVVPWTPLPGGPLP